MTARLPRDRTLTLPGVYLSEIPFSVQLRTENDTIKLWLLSGTPARTLSREDVGPDHPAWETLQSDTDNTLRLWAAEQLEALAKGWRRAGGGG